uniref:Uncharacterized protein n=1 Tax=Equus asinus asinus TaxID=83772 RepID=A0A8C4PLD3_EQUAS
MASKTSELSCLDIFIQCVGCYTCITAIIELSHGSFEKQDRDVLKASVLDFLIRCCVIGHLTTKVRIQEMEDKVTSPEKAEEAKLKARYPHLGQKPGGSDFLRKRLQKGVSSQV